MASANGTIVGQRYGSYSLPDYTTTNPAYAGYNGESYYAYFLKFTTPAFTGKCASISFNLYMYAGVGSTANMRHAICTSDANATKYLNTTAAVSDAYQVSGTVGTTAIANMTSDTAVKTITVNTAALAPSTTYYLVLWSSDKTGVSIRQVLYTGGNPAVTVTYYNTYTLSISAGTGSTIMVQRGGTTLANGATITHGDVLTITFAAKAGYRLTLHTVNGSSFASGGQHTVANNVTVAALAAALAYPIGTGTGVEMACAYIGNGSTFDLYVAYIGNGSTWDLYPNT